MKTKMRQKSVKLFDFRLDDKDAGDVVVTRVGRAL
jgi:hypothetical protein